MCELQMAETDNLVERSNELIATGMDFPTIWEAYLRRHPAVIGPPIQEYRSNEPILAIPLFYRQVLIFCSSEAKFMIE
jgi:hypothetical protein